MVSKNGKSLLILILLIVVLTITGKYSGLFSFIGGVETFVDYGLTTGGSAYVDDGNTVFFSNVVLNSSHKHDINPVITFDNSITHVRSGADGYDLNTYAGSYIKSDYVNVWLAGLPVTLSPNRNMRGTDFILSASWNSVPIYRNQGQGYECKAGGVKIKLPGLEQDVMQVLNCGTYNTPLFQYPSWVFKVLFDSENANHVRVYYPTDTTLVADYVYSGDTFIPVIESTSANRLDILSFKIREPCPSGVVYVDEAFQGPQNISINSLRYRNNIGFCNLNPSTWYSGSTPSNDDFEVNSKLQTSQSVTIPAGKILKVSYYVNYYSGQFPVACKDEYLDFFDTCRNVSGYVYVCSEGVFSALDGTCSINPYTQDYCKLEDAYLGKIYGRFDVHNLSCFYNMPEEDICVKGSLGECVGGVCKCVWAPTCGSFDYTLNATYGIGDPCCGTDFLAYNPISQQCESFAYKNNDTNDTIVTPPCVNCGITVAGGGGGGGTHYDTTKKETPTIPSLIEATTPTKKSFWWFVAVLVGGVAYLRWRKKR